MRSWIRIVNISGIGVGAGQKEKAWETVKYMVVGFEEIRNQQPKSKNKGQETMKRNM